MTQTGSPDPRNDRICITSSCPRQFVEPFALAAYAAIGSIGGSLTLSPRTIRAQAMRAILLARATAATLIGRRSMIRASQSRFVPCLRAYRMTAIAPDEQPPQVSIALFGDAAETLLAAGRMLLGNQ